MNLRYRLHNLVNYFATKSLLDKTTKEQLTAYLQELGNTQVEVAKNLRNWGFKGQVNGWNSDPIHNYLKSKNPDWKEITVHRSHIGVSYSDSNNQTQWEKIWLGENENNFYHVSHFIHDFDSKKYPELIES